MQLSLPQMLSLVERAVSSTKPNLATSGFLRRLAQLQRIALNNSLRSLKVELPKGGAHSLPPGWRLKEPKKDCGHC